MPLEGTLQPWGVGRTAGRNELLLSPYPREGQPQGQNARVPHTHRGPPAPVTPRPPSVISAIRVSLSRCPQAVWGAGSAPSLWLSPLPGLGTQHPAQHLHPAGPGPHLLKHEVPSKMRVLAWLLGAWSPRRTSPASQPHLTSSPTPCQALPPNKTHSAPRSH